MSNKGTYDRYVRYSDQCGDHRFGGLLGESIQPLLGGAMWTDDHVRDGDEVLLSSVNLLTPVLPSKVVCVASNYRKHAIEMGKSLPTVPKLFIKPSTSVIGPGVDIEIPPGTQRVDHEAELGVVIGTTMCRVDKHHALEHVFGYVCLNDVTARDFQRQDGQFTRGKGFDTFCPIGPWVSTGLSPHDLGIRCSVDGQLRQDGRTSDMVFDVRTLLSFISSVMTLLPGDIVATGTPSGVGPLQPGQRVSIEIEGIGALNNPVCNRVDRHG